MKRKQVSYRKRYSSRGDRKQNPIAWNKEADQPLNHFLPLMAPEVLLALLKGPATVSRLDPDESNPPLHKSFFSIHINNILSSRLIPSNLSLPFRNSD